MKREQLQSWNILSFDPKKTDVDEHKDLINTLGDMVDQKEEAKMEKFIETMPTMIQTHLSICKDWAETKDKAKSLEHIIQKCDHQSCNALSYNRCNSTWTIFPYHTLS